jgi:hypothetical protein
VALVALSFAIVTTPAEAAHQIDRETPDGGFTLSPGLWVAGDVTLETHVPESGPAVAALDDLSLLVRWEPTTRLALFGEMRVEDVLEWRESEGVETGDGEVNLERAYLEALLTPSVAVRLGRVFTPFGLWNVVRRAPLTWTVEEPAAADDMFPEHSTGASLLYQSTRNGWTYDAAAYGPIQGGATLTPTHETGWLAGMRLAVAKSLGGAFAGFGVNAAGFRAHDDRAWTTSTGLDMELAAAGQLLTSELTFRIPADHARVRCGLYVQDVLPLATLVSDLYGVARFESFQPARGRTAIGLLLGLFWRPFPRLVLRADYLFATRRLERLDPGLHATISVLL